MRTLVPKQEPCLARILHHRPSCRPFLKFHKDERGSELVEFALTLPLLITLSFGMLQVILFLACYVGATYGSRAAVRYAAVHSASSLKPCSSSDLAGIVNTYAFTIPIAGVRTVSTWSPSNAVGNTVTVQVTLTFPTAIPVSQLRNLSVVTTAAAVVLQ